jgi:hypothetical protein
MINGRHLLLLGVIACAGLISVHDGQLQTDCCYQIAGSEKELRNTRDEIELCKIKHQALQSPKAVMDRATELNLKVVPPIPVTPPVVPPTQPAPRQAPRSLGLPEGARRAPAPEAANTRVRSARADR